MNTILSGKIFPWHECLHIISLNKSIDLQVFNSSKKTNNFFSSNFNPYLYFSFLSFSFPFKSFAKGITFSSMNSIISLFEWPAWILSMTNNFSPLFFNSLNFLIKYVFPHPVSPIIIIGIFALILINIKHILRKLSLVNT